MDPEELRRFLCGLRKGDAFTDSGKLQLTCAAVPVKSTSARNAKAVCEGAKEKSCEKPDFASRELKVRRPKKTYSACNNRLEESVTVPSTELTVRKPKKTYSVAHHVREETSERHHQCPEDPDLREYAEMPMFEVVDCKGQSPEDDTGSDTACGPQMLEAVECKVELHEDDTGPDVVCEPQMFEAVELKVEPPEENAEPDVIHEPQIFEAVELKVEPPEDDTRSDTAPEPQVFEFVAVKTEPCNGTPKDTGLDVPELQASASAAKGDDSTKRVEEAAPHLSPALPAVDGRKSKSVIPRQARKIILNVANCCELEKRRKLVLFPLSEPLKRAAAYTGRSVESLVEMRRSSEADSGSDSAAPTPSKKRKLNDGKTGDFDERVVRETIEEFYTVRKTVPTLGKLASTLREKTGCECESTAALRRRLKSMGFVWRKVDEEDRRTFLLERFSLVRRRSRFIVGMKYMRECNKNIFYLDESWIDTNLNCGKCWNGRITSDGPSSASDAERLVVWSVGSRWGFVEEAQLSFRPVSAKKWTSTANFEKWFETRVLPNLPPGSVVVTDDAPHHCRQPDAVPLVYSPKMHMVAWLRRRGIECDNSMMKYVLWELIQANGGSRKDYIVDQMASVRGHSVIRLPRNVRDLNAGNMAWAKITDYVREHATPQLSFANLQKVVAAAFKSVTDKDWEGFCDRVQGIEEDYWRRDSVLEDAVDDVIRNPGTPDSSDDSENSITEDSETESD